MNSVSPPERESFTKDQTGSCRRSPAHWIIIVPEEHAGLFLGSEQFPVNQQGLHEVVPPAHQEPRKKVSCFANILNYFKTKLQ